MNQKKPYSLIAYNKFNDLNRMVVETEIPFSPTVTVFNEVDFSNIEKFRSRFESQNRPPYTSFIVSALAATFKEYPFANANCDNRAFAFLRGRRIVRYKEIHIAIAAEQNVGDDVPFAFADIIRNSDKKTLLEITEFLYNLRSATAQNNRQLYRVNQFVRWVPRWIWKVALYINKISPTIWNRDRGAAALISSPSKYGVDMLSTSWTWPIGVSFGFVKERPIVKDGIIVARKTSHITLNFDRRILSGAQAARFFNFFCNELKNFSDLS